MENGYSCQINSLPSKQLRKKPNVLCVKKKKIMYPQLGIWMPPPDKKEMNMCSFDLTLFKCNLLNCSPKTH